MTLRRCEGWEKKLESFIDESKTISFEWGVCDCVCWACEWMAQLSGFDAMAEFRGKYGSEEDAYALLAQHDGIGAELSKRLPERLAGYHKRGDIALCSVAGKETLGIVGARGFVFFKTMGLGVVAKRIDIVQAWGVD